MSRGRSSGAPNSPRALLRSAALFEFGTGFWPPETGAPKGARRRCLRAETGNRRPPHARNGRKKGFSASGLNGASFQGLGGGPTRARTCDPLIVARMKQPRSALRRASRSKRPCVPEMLPSAGAMRLAVRFGLEGSRSALSPALDAHGASCQFIRPSRWLVIACQTYVKAG